MKLSKRSNGIWMVEATVAGKRVRKSTGERDKQAAKDRAFELLTAMKRVAGVQDWTLMDALRDCYDRVWAESKSSIHIYKRLDKLDRDYEFHVNRLLVDTTYDTLIDLTAVMERRGMKPATINRYLALFSKAMAEAVKRGKLTIKPPLPYRKESKGKLRWITKAEEKALADKAWELWPTADAEKMVSLIVVLVDTGCRLSEILKTSKLQGLTQITLHDTKNGQSRSVPLTERAQQHLQMVPNWTAGQAIARFSRLREACALPDVTLHTLRHTCASRLVQAGMDLYRVKEWLGHSSITVTQRYAHLSPSNLTAGADLLAQFED